MVNEKVVDVYKCAENTGILLNANELYENVNNNLMSQIKEAMGDVMFNRYPDTSCKTLRDEYAKLQGIDSHEVLAGNGSDELIGLLIGIALGNGKKLFTLVPDFSMYNYYASMNEAQVVGLKTKEDGSFQIEDFISEAKKENPDMIMFSNPNNPTGSYVESEDIIKILEAFPKIPVIIDEAYGEFAGESMIPYINIYENLYVTRTLSKAYGLAAARVGFLVSNSKNISFVKEKQVPFTVNSMSQAIGTIVIKNADKFIPVIENIRKWRDTLYNKCKSGKDYNIYPSRANFLMVRSKKKIEILQAFKQHNIAVRNFKDDTFRITIGNEEENLKVKGILERF
ncbi:histidinol-phosphate aminotransferase [Hathewaya proteolytica DSM 3090]|uniref:Histidinol-phosphate aminotransferase n=1 Tax=Hathewaya proteolytica DSM 3090 TaxID=1121331 RepID=A0A1M6RGZ2_9CLOT|nr:histidinol-phosphate transaminase [Hathewaya proteolytica]SHK31712.1 histidinol-phosphate aminotransferase [Hathewaya proteolytica DSM 3090]